jgi:cytochrome c peroxidase
MKKTVLVMVIVFTLTAIGGLVLSHAKMKYLEKEGVNKAMIQWNKALGVKCSFCHTKDRTETYKNLAGKTVSEEELKALVHQRIARAMLGNMLYLNEKENQNYTCNTCHQGSEDVEVKQ